MVSFLYLNHFTHLVSVTAGGPESPWEQIDASKFYGRLQLIRIISRASAFSVLKFIEIVIFGVYSPSLLAYLVRFLQHICPKQIFRFSRGGGGFNFNISSSLYFHFVIKFRLLLSVWGLYFWCPLNLKMLPTPLLQTWYTDKHQFADDPYWLASQWS